MAVVTLLDVNVLVALFDPDHVHHDLAHDWFAQEGSSAWATCPTTENGFLRVLTNPAYHGSPLRLGSLAALLRRFCGHQGHHFWHDEVSFRDAKLFDLAFGRTPAGDRCLPAGPGEAKARPTGHVR